MLTGDLRRQYNAPVMQVATLEGETNIHDNAQRLTMTMSEEGSSGIRLNPRRALGLAGRVPVRVRVVLYTNTPRIVDTIV